MQFSEGLKTTVKYNRICKKVVFLLVFVFFTLNCKRPCSVDTGIALLEEEYNLNLQHAIKETNGKLSMPFSLKANEIANELKDEYKIANSCIELSHDCEKLGQLNKALSYILKAAVIFENKVDHKSMAISYNRIGTLYFKQGDTVLSLQYLNDALRIHRKYKLHRYIAGDLINLGEIYRINGKYSEAKHCLTEALDFYKTDNDKLKYAYSIGNLGLVYTSMGLHDSAKICLNEAGLILEKENDYYPITFFIAEEAKLLVDAGKYDEALDMLHHSISISKQEGLIEQMASGYKLLSEIEQKTGNLDEAIHAFKNHITYRDSLVNIDIIRKMESQRLNFEVSKREVVIDNLTHINKLRIRITLILSVGIISILIFVVVLYRTSAKLRLANFRLNSNKIELEQKNINIENALQEKNVLIKEIHHRVKNNLQIISSLLSLQSRQLNDKAAKIAIADSHQRLQAISFIHQNLYQTENLAFINAQEYIQQLMAGIKRAFSRECSEIEHVLTIENLNFDVDTAVPLGLILNELAVNVYKYAFPDDCSGKIEISLKSVSKGKYQLDFKDNGIGFPNGFNPENSTSLGIKLVYTLSRQLEGDLTVSNTNGAAFSLLFLNKMYRQ